MLTILVHARQRLNGPPGSFAHAGRGGVLVRPGLGAVVLVWRFLVRRGFWGEGIGTGLRLGRSAGGIQNSEPA